MPRARNENGQIRHVRDIGLAASLAASGYPIQLEETGSVVYFVISGDPERIHRLEEGYWNGTLKLPARDLLMNHRSLKDRLYAAKGAAR